MESHNNEKWLTKSLSTHIDQSVVVLDTGNVFDRCQSFDNQLKFDIVPSFDENPLRKDKNSIHVNHCEASIVLKLIKTLLMVNFTFNKIIINCILL